MYQSSGQYILPLWDFLHLISYIRKIIWTYVHIFL